MRLAIFRTCSQWEISSSGDITPCGTHAARHAYGERDAAEKGGEAENHILERVLAIGPAERRQHAVEVGHGVLHCVLVILLHKSAICRVWDGLVLLGGEQSLHPVFSRFLTVEAEEVVLIKIIVGFHQQAVL